MFFAEGPFWTVDTLFWTDINVERVLPKFLFYQLKTKDLASLNVGTAVPSLTVEILNEVQIDLPPLEEQEQVVEILDVLDKKIVLNNKDRVAHNERLFNPAKGGCSPKDIDVDHDELFRTLCPEAHRSLHGTDCRTAVDRFVAEHPAPVNVKL